MTGNFPVGGPVPPSFGPAYPSPKHSRAGVWLGSIACVLGAAALVVAVMALMTTQRDPVATPVAEKPISPAEELLVPDADKPLCKDIGPLLREETDRASDFVAATAPESPERRAAIPKFRSDTLDWYRRAQSILNRHLEPDRYLTRTIQSYIDGALLYSENLHDDRGPDPYDNDAYRSAIIYVGGPLAACYKLGTGW